MSRLHVRLQLQFPYVKVLVLGVLISLLGLGEVVIGILAFTHKIWGHYLGTGLWCGIVIFISGICAIIASQIRAPVCAKLYFATSVVGMLVSFVMLILSSGGLDYDSNFYKFHHFNPTKHIKKHNSTVMVHGLALGFSICSFLANVVSVIICMKYVVFDKKLKYTTERTTRKGTNSLQRNVLRGETTNARSSTSSRAPLAERSHRRSRPRRGSEQGGRRRSEAEEFLPGGSRTDSARRNKDKRHRHRREERQDQTEYGSVRDSSNRHEQSRNRRNEIPVPVQVERMTIYDGVVQADVVHNDLLPTHFNEDELPPYEEAVRDTYVPVSDLNNQILSNNAHNESMRTHVGGQIHACDIDEDKIYQNVNCCNIEENEIQQSAPAIEPQVIVRAGSARERENTQVIENILPANSVNFNNPSNSVRNKASTKVKTFQEQRQNETNEEIELYVNQSVVPKQSTRTDKVVNHCRDKASLSTSALCDMNSENRPQTRRCVSTVSAVSLPLGNPPPKPPRFNSARSDLREILDSSRSDSSLGITVQKGVTSDKTYVNIDDVNSLPKHSGPKLNVLKGDNSGLNCRNKNSRYKADYIQLQIRQEPEGSSCISDKEGKLNPPTLSDKTGMKLDGAPPPSSRTSPVTRIVPSVSCNPSERNGRPKDLAVLSSSVSKGRDTLKSDLIHPKELNLQTDADGLPVSPVTPSPASLDQSGFSPVRFGSPTSAFKPYRRGDSSPSSGLTSPASDSDMFITPINKPGTDTSASLTQTSDKAVQKLSSWKEFMLPSPHSKTDQNHPLNAASDKRKLSAVVSQPTISTGPKMSLNTFPRPTPPTFIIPPLSSIRYTTPSGPSKSDSSVAAINSKTSVPATLGASPHLHMSKDSYVVLPSNLVTSPSGCQLGMTSPSSKSSNPGTSSAGITSTLSASSTQSSNSPWSSRLGSVTSVSSSLFQPSCNSSANRNNVIPSGSICPGINDGTRSSVAAGASLQAVHRTNRNDLIGAQAQPCGPTGAQGPSLVQPLPAGSGQVSDQSPDQGGVMSQRSPVVPPGQRQQAAQEQGNPSPQQPQPPQPQQQQRPQQQGKPLFSILL